MNYEQKQSSAFAGFLHESETIILQMKVVAMKKINMLIPAFALLAGVALFGNGCTTYHRDSGSDHLTRPESISAIPYYTEYQVGDRIENDGDASVLFWFFQFSDGKYCQLSRDPRLSFLDWFFEIFSPTQKTISNAKNTALFNACETNEADQILGATFKYEITDYIVFATVKCTLTGFPAQSTGVKLLEKQPVILDEWQKLEYLAPYEIPRNYSDPVQTILRDNKN